MSEELTIRLDPDISDFPAEKLKIGRNIGAGGMGLVCEAEDERLLRRIAIKMIRPGGQLDAGLRRRLVAEAQLTAQLDHPNIVPVYRLGSAEESGLYFSMKRVEGRTLTEVIRGRPIRLRGAEELMNFFRYLSRSRMRWPSPIVVEFSIGISSLKMSWSDVSGRCI